MEDEFNSTNDRSYTNGEITVFWKPKLCIHATTCYKELIEVFNPRKRPWVNMDGASTEEIIRVVKMCPTAALSFEYNKNVTPKTTDTETLAVENEIKVMEDGPLIIKGNFKITGSDGTVFKTMKMTSLCRCGASNKMPFCDGTHRKIGFTGK